MTTFIMLPLNYRRRGNEIRGGKTYRIGRQSVKHGWRENRVADVNKRARRRRQRRHNILVQSSCQQQKFGRGKGDLSEKGRGPLRSPLRSGPLLVRSLTYVLTGATEPLDNSSGGCQISVGKPARALPFACGLPPNRRPRGAADLVRTYCALYSGSETPRLSMTPNEVPDLTSAS